MISTGPVYVDVNWRWKCIARRSDACCAGAVMSGNGETSVVMKGITHGACDYLLKPVRIEELRNIWQHVVRKKRRDVRIVS